MAPRLNFLGKQLFLEHMLHRTGKEQLQYVLKVLLINNTFLTIANNRKVYEFCVSIDLKKRIRISFFSPPIYQTAFASTTFENICSILKLLKPPLSHFDYTTNSEDFSADKLLTLINAVNGKIGLSIYDEKNLNLLKLAWKQLSELGCHGYFFERIEEDQLKSFDALDVCCIKNYDQLNAVLRYPSKRLVLKIKNFEDVQDSTVQLHKNCAKRCTLYFYNIRNINQISSIVNKIIDSCKEMKKLELFYQNGLGQIDNFTDLLSDISQKHRLFIETVQMLHQPPPDLSLSILCNSHKTREEFGIEFPDNWQDQIKKIEGIKSIEEKLDLKQKFNPKALLKIEGHFMDATFCFYYCRCNHETCASNTDEERAQMEC